MNQRLSCKKKKYELKNQYDEFNGKSKSSNKVAMPNKIDPDDNSEVPNYDTNDYSDKDDASYNLKLHNFN